MRTLFFLLVLVASAWGGCRQADWQVVLDRVNQWATCNGREYIKGLWRHDNGGDGDERLGRIEYANCCSPPASYGNSNDDCLNANWWGVWDSNNRWAVCPNGRYLQGVYKSDDKWLHNLEEGRCCRPSGHPSNWGHCYDHDVGLSFDRRGWSNCNDGYYLVGLWRGTCDRLYCIEKFKCCKMQERAINGGWGQFGAWGACSKPCGGGTQSRSRTCTSPPPSNGGAQCSGVSSESQPCNSQACPVQGGWSGFEVWGQCSRPCGGGEQERTRSCTNPPPAHGGAYCTGSDRETQPCNPDPCPVDGGWSEFGPWGECSEECGGGEQDRRRTCTNPPPAHGGAVCAGSDTETQSCNEDGCPVDGGWGDFGEWGSCSKTCGGGVQTRSRPCNNPTPAYGGAKCSGIAEETQACSENPCEVERVNGGWSEWSGLGECSKSCGKGKRYKTRSCTDPPPSGGGKKCKGKNKKGKKCNAGPCELPLEELGCFVQGNPPDVLADFKGTYKPSKANKVTQACAKLAKAKGYSHFAIGENRLTCFSGPDFANSYKNGGEAPSKKCKKGLGSKGFLGVFRIQ